MSQYDFNMMNSESYADFWKKCSKIPKG